MEETDDEFNVVKEDPIIKLGFIVKFEVRYVTRNACGVYHESKRYTTQLLS